MLWGCNVHTVEVAPTICQGLVRHNTPSLQAEEHHRLASEQHLNLRETLSRMGVEIKHHEITDPECHDLHFVEDLLTFLPDRRNLGRKVALLHPVGAPSRRPEVEQVKLIAAEHADTVFDLRIFGNEETTIDGGDLEIIGDVILVGHGTRNGHLPRTTLAGVALLERIVKPLGYRVVPISHNRLHLTSDNGFYGPNPRDGRPVVAITPATLNTNLDVLRSVRVFKKLPLDIIEIPDAELMGGNGLGFNGRALVQEGFSTPAQQLAARDFEIHTVNFEAFWMVDGGPSCLCAFEGNPMDIIEH